ncbi:MAG: hypothetical protein KF819_29660 [Labilithrix sp.]|nr:hypothetical protein [Labilithrix sp.]
MRSTLRLCAALVVLSAFAYACGVANESALSDFGGEGTGARGDAAPNEGPSAGASPTDLAPVDNAVILVHAAKALPFRLCFENELDRRPLPDADLMPESNVVGVEVGSAVRLGPLRGAPGMIFVIDEFALRFPTSEQPSCQKALSRPEPIPYAIRLPPGPQNTAADKDLSKGVHLLVLTGCTGNTALNTYSQAECGSDWTPAAGNLAIKEIELTGANRASPSTLPAQIVNLSQPLESARAGRTLSITFGDLLAQGAKHEDVASGPPLYGEASPKEPATLTYTPEDLPSYDSLGFRVQLQPPGGGAAETVLEQSLARVQNLSAPRDLPTSYFAAASNYALLLLGDPAPTFRDGGADDDPRRKLHLLAVPVINPKGSGAGDAGADAP